MNYILLEGMSLYIFIALLIYLIITSIAGYLFYFSAERQRDELKDRLYEEKKKNIALSRENFRFKLKYGELKAEEKADV